MYENLTPIDPMEPGAPWLPFVEPPKAPKPCAVLLPECRVDAILAAMADRPIEEIIAALYEAAHQ